MDTFMDKLASRLNAQEMIRANSQAEAKENERLNKEVEVYKQCLEQMREISQQNVGAADDVTELIKVSMDKIAAIQAGSDKSEEVIAAVREELGKSDEAISAMRNSLQNSTSSLMNSMQSNANSVMNEVQSKMDSVMNAIAGNSDEIVAKLQEGNDGFKEALLQELLAEMKKELKSQEENVHKECVKVYRNVQAVITEENDKQTKLILDNNIKLKKKATAALVCGILAMSFAALGLIVSVLDIFGVFAMLF